MEIGDTMDAGRTTTAVIIGVVMLLIVTVVVIPILGAASYTIVPGYNDPDAYVTNEIPSGEYTITSEGYSIDGGEAVPIANGQWFLMSDSLNVFKNSDTDMVLFNAGNSNLLATLADLTINSTAGTWTGTTTTSTTVSGSLGANARLVTNTATDTGVYNSNSFSVNGDDTIYGYLHSKPVTISGGSCNVRAEVTGTAEELTVTKAFLTGERVALDPDDVTVTIAAGSLTVDGNVETVSANPVLSISFDYDGTTYTTTSLFEPYFAGPIEYDTHVDSTIKNLIDIVPLLMVVGVIMMIISVAILRK